MPNTIKAAEIFQKKLDEQMLVGATSGWMEINAGNVVYNGGDTIKVPELSVEGLKAYDRAKGFADGSVTLEYKDYKLTQDRGRSFSLDALSVDESNFIANAGNVLSTFQKTQVIPEVDAYRYSKIASLAEGHATTADLTADTILAALQKEVAEVEDMTGDASNLVIVMSTKTQNLLSTAKGVERYINVGEFTNGNVSFKVKSFDDVPILAVPSARFKTAYNFDDGFKADGGAKDINFIVMPKTAPVAISKTDKIRIFTPEQNQNADAWKIDYRKFHDLYIPAHQLELVRVHKAQ